MISFSFSTFISQDLYNVDQCDGFGFVVQDIEQDRVFKGMIELNVMSLALGHVPQFYERLKKVSERKFMRTKE